MDNSSSSSAGVNVLKGMGALVVSGDSRENDKQQQPPPPWASPRLSGTGIRFVQPDMLVRKHIGMAT
jgi:hypothetical protein